MISNSDPGKIKRGYIEYLAYGIVLILLIILPLIFWDISDINQRHRIIGGWVRITPFILIFLIHNFWLLPKLLLRKKLALYLISTTILIVLINYIFIYSSLLHEFLFKLGRPFDPNGKIPPEIMDAIQDRGSHLHARGTGHFGPGRGQGYWRWHNPAYLAFTYNVIISMLVVGFNAAIKLTTEWFRNEQQRKELEKETIRTQLSALQHQVSPHFFMNTLNNIHALIDYKKEDAQEAILRLSKMMRYLLYDSESGKTSLAKEIEFLESYIDLMRLRMQKSVELKINFPVVVPELEIYPFLFIAFIENAFKYGIRPRGKSFIHIILEVTGKKLHFHVSNSKTTEIADINGEGGIGIENTRKRLELLYGSDYDLNIYDREEEFEIDLILPV
jgi:hypothetical protein